LGVDSLLELCKVAGARPPEFLFEDDLQHNVALARGRRSRSRSGCSLRFNPADDSGKSARMRWRLNSVGPFLAVPPSRGSRSVVVPACLRFRHEHPIREVAIDRDLPEATVVRRGAPVG
jgi:hypothetical protein